MWVAICGEIGESSNKLARNLLQIYPQAYGVVLPTTTAPLFDGELNGRLRHCVDKQEFLRLLAADEIIGHWIVGGRHSGLSLASIHAVESLGLNPIIQIGTLVLPRLQRLADAHARELVAVLIEECPTLMASSLDRHLRTMPPPVKASIVKASLSHHLRLTNQDWFWKMPLNYDALLAAYELDERLSRHTQSYAHDARTLIQERANAGG